MLSLLRVVSVEAKQNDNVKHRGMLFTRPQEMGASSEGKAKDDAKHFGI